MKTQSNISSNIIIAATITASCINMDYNESFTENYSFNSNNYDFLDNFPIHSTKKLSEGTSSIFWSRRDNKEDILQHNFKLNLSSANVIEMANNLFNESIPLDENMTKALHNTVNRVGKDFSNLPNRL